MSEAEHPARRSPGHRVTVDDLRQLVGASSPHFALQIRNRIARLIEGLPEDDPARLEGEREIARLTQLGYSGEVRGHHAEDGLAPLPSNSAGHGEPGLGDERSVRRGFEAQEALSGGSGE